MVVYVRYFYYTIRIGILRFCPNVIQNIDIFGFSPINAPEIESSTKFVNKLPISVAFMNIKRAAVRAKRPRAEMTHERAEATMMRKTPVPQDRLECAKAIVAMRIGIVSLLPSFGEKRLRRPGLELAMIVVPGA